MEAKRRHRLAKSFEHDLLRYRLRKILGVFDVAFLIDQNFPGARLALKAGGKIHHVTDRGIVFRVIGA